MNTLLAKWLAVGLLSACWLAACHDTRRNNSLDPVLTPAVELSAVMDSTSGVVDLSWTPYFGEMPFSAYQVLRNIVNRTVVDTLQIITDLSQLTYTDDSLAADTVYEYRIAVLNSKGFAAFSQRQRIDGFTVRAVDLLPAEGDPATGTVRLTWSQYSDPGFSAYRIFRREVGTDEDLMIGEIALVTNTTFVDTAVRHSINYIYRVVVETVERELSSTGLEGRMRFTPRSITLLDMDASTASATVQWLPYTDARFSHYRVERQTAEGGFQNMATIDDSTQTSFVDRGLKGNTLYIYRIMTVTDAGEEVAGVTLSRMMHPLQHSWSIPESGLIMPRLYGANDGVSILLKPDLLRYDSEGELITEEQIYFRPDFDLITANRSFASTITQDGLRLMSHTWIDGAVTIWGEDIRETRVTLETPAEINIPLEGFSFVSTEIVGDGGEVLYNGSSTFWHLEFMAGEIVVQESLTGLPYQDIDEQPFLEAMPDWEKIRGSVGSSPGSERINLSGMGLFRRPTDFYTDFQLTVTLALDPVRGGILFGDEEGNHVELILDGWGEKVVLRWMILDEEGSVARADSVSMPLPIYQYTPYTVTVERQDGVVRATVIEHNFWGDQREIQEDFSSLATLGDRVLLGVGTDLFAIDSEGQSELIQSFNSIISDVKVWDDEGVIGVCLPFANRVAIGTLVGGSLRFPPNRQIGAGYTGSQPGQFVYPVAVAAGADGRIYVLDAGNARIQVFSSRGRYITEWGELGDGAGQFYFGDGGRAGGGAAVSGPDFYGSLGVDDAGFIYVLDANNRVQKFAP